MATADESWTIGPAESRLVRWLLNLANGILAGYVVALLALLVGDVGGSPELGAVGLLLGLVLVIVVTRYVVAVSSSPTYWLFDAYAENVSSLEVVAATAVATAGLVALPGGVDDLHLFVLPIWLLFTVLAMVLSSKGSVDWDDGTLTYTAVRHHEIPLTRLTSLTPLQAGGRRFLWLSFQREDGPAVDRLVGVPAAVSTTLISRFGPPEREADETEERGRSSRAVLITGLLVFGFLAGGIAVLVYLGKGGGGVWLPLGPGVSLFGPLFVCFLIAHYTNLFSRAPKR